MLLDGRQASAIDAAAHRLRDGGLIGLPTETVYGLAADAEQACAVAAIFSTKGRPSDHPLIVHVAEPADAAHFAATIPPFAQALMAAFWPGPLTLILPRAPGVAEAAAGGQPSIGLRCPSHPVAQAVLRAARPLGVRGLAAPSANAFGRVSPTQAAHVVQEFGDDLWVLDGGACDIGIESTIVDCTRGSPVLLRPGGIYRDQIEAACGQPVRTPQSLAQPDPKASGTLEAHYAPRARVRLMDAKALQTGLDLLGEQAKGLVVWSRTRLRAASPLVSLQPMPERADLAAHVLFAELRRFDALGAQLIWVESPPADSAWDGVRDRLTRASAAA